MIRRYVIRWYLHVLAIVGVVLIHVGCAGFYVTGAAGTVSEEKRPKVFIVMIDALKSGVLMESLASLPHFNAIIRGEDGNYPFINFQNVLTSIPTLTRPSEATILTGVYPLKHGIVSSIWFDRRQVKIVYPLSLNQTRVVKILEKTGTDTIFDYARKSGKTAMATTTQVAKGLDDGVWVRQSAVLWGGAFFSNLFLRGHAIPDGAYVDRGTTQGLLRGYLSNPSDGLEGHLRSEGDIPDLIVLYYAGLDIATHYPRRFKEDAVWSIDEIQRWYLAHVLDPEIGKVTAFLKKEGLFENTVFVFISDHGQTKIETRIDDEDFTRRIGNTVCATYCSFDHDLKIAGRGYSPEEANIVILPGAATKAIHVKNRQNGDWLSPPRLCKDVKPVVDRLIEDRDMRRYLNFLLVASYLGERFEGKEEVDAFWVFDIQEYRQSARGTADFIFALKPLSMLDEVEGESLRVPFMYRRNYTRDTKPDIILVNKPSCFFVPNDEIYGHQGSFYREDAVVSMIISGPAVHRFSSRPQTILRQIDTVDVVPTVANLADITIDRTIDGKNRLSEVK